MKNKSGGRFYHVADSQTHTLLTAPILTEWPGRGTIGGMTPDHFPILILIARPAAGKSEVIRYLSRISDEERLARFHLGPLKVLDDFPMLWSWFEQDALLEKIFERPRLYTTEDGYFLHQDLWNLLIRRLALEYEKWRRDDSDQDSAILEFSRGSEHGGYRVALSHLGASILLQAACLYVKVSFDESLRKNRKRFNPNRPHSILEHTLPDEKLHRLYGSDDWDELSATDLHHLTINSIQVPYVTMDNEDDVTSVGGNALASRLEQHMSTLWKLWLRSQIPEG